MLHGIELNHSSAPCCSRRTSRLQTEESREPITPQGLWWNLIKKFVGKLILTKHKGHADAAVAVNWTWQWGKSIRQRCVCACVCEAVFVSSRTIRVPSDCVYYHRGPKWSARINIQGRNTHTPSNASLSRTRTQVRDNTQYMQTRTKQAYIKEQQVLLSHTHSPNLPYAFPWSQAPRLHAFSLTLSLSLYVCVILFILFI